MLGTIEGNTWSIERGVMVPNEADDPINDFLLTRWWLSYAIGIAERRGYALLGVGHTHLPYHDQRPSEADLKGLSAWWIGLVYLPHSDQTFLYWTD